MFSNELIEKIRSYFRYKISSEEANECLNSLADLYLLLVESIESNSEEVDFPAPQERENQPSSLVILD